MTPQIVSYDHGKHNAELAQSTARILEGGSWKQQRVVMLIPSSAMIPAKVALSHWNLMFPPNNGVHRMLCLGMEVGQAYSSAIEAVLAHPDLSKWEYVLTLEHDNVPPPDGLVKLLARMEAHLELACIGGLYWTKGPQGVPQIWGDARDPQWNCRPQPPVAGQLVECCATGMGFSLFRLAMFKDPKLRRPWFATAPCVSQDLYFWQDAKAHGYRCAIDCDVLVGHHDAGADFTW